KGLPFSCLAEITGESPFPAGDQLTDQPNGVRWAGQFASVTCRVRQDSQERAGLFDDRLHFKSQNLRGELEGKTRSGICSTRPGTGWITRIARKAAGWLAISFGVRAGPSFGTSGSPRSVGSGLSPTR